MAISFYVLLSLHKRFGESHRCDPLFAFLCLTRICTRTAPLECIAQGHFSRVDLSWIKGREGKRIGLMFKPACEQRRPWIQVFCGEWAHSRFLTAITPCGVSDGAVHLLHAMDTCAASRRFGRPAVPWCTHPWKLTVNNPQYGTMSMTFLRVPSASLSYCKPAAVPGPGALSDSPR